MSEHAHIGVKSVHEMPLSSNYGALLKAKQKPNMIGYINNILNPGILKT